MSPDYPQIKKTSRKIIYIMGTGRSGTTILEILLSNSRGITGIGEATHIFRDGFTDNQLCACGRKTSECALWANVRNASGWSDDDVRAAAALFPKFAWHDRFPFVVLKAWREKELERFKQFNDLIFSTVASKTCAHTLVDSSKYAARALTLARLYPDDVSIICLTRSFSGLVRAFSKRDTEQPAKSFSETLLYYLYCQACFRIVSFLTRKPVLWIRYEDMRMNPIAEMSRIEEWGKVDLSDTKDKLSSNEILQIGHIVTGNRLRHQKTIRFEHESRPK